MLLPVIPLELLERIIGFTSSHDARSCALTCNALLHSSRANIFSHVQVSIRTGHFAPPLKDIPHLLNLLKESPHISPLIRHFSFLDLNDTTTDADCPSSYIDQLVKILDQLTHLKSLSIIRSERYYGCYWVDIPVSVQSALYKRFLSGTLETVSAQLFEQSLTFLERCPRLKHLHITGSFTESLICTSISSLKPVLKSLRFTATNSPINDIKLYLGGNKNSLLDLSQLETLALDTAYSQAFAFGPWIAHIATLSASSLTELYWELDLRETISGELSVRLSEIPNLQTLVIICRVTALEVRVDILCNWIQRLIESRTICVPLLSLITTMPWSDDPEPLQTLIKSGIQGTRSATFSFIHVPEMESDRGAIQATLEVLRIAAAQQAEVDVTLISPFDSWNAFDKLRSKGVFIL
ncbi:hypothetical protein DL96DRAFT_1590350 [Flagelloscypha sp. PMI_526]|nr:hypothetical protein DL96DRAFT_1590350 [Flagelloscypha sp. PMI_526]